MLFKVDVAHLIEIEVFLGVAIYVDLAQLLVVVEVRTLLLITVRLILLLYRNNNGNIPFPAHMTKKNRWEPSDDENNDDEDEADSHDSILQLSLLLVLLKLVAWVGFCIAHGLAV